VDARVVTGRKRLGSQAPSEIEHRIEADVTVATDARVRRQARGMIESQCSTTTGAKLGAEVDREVGHPDTVRKLARPAHRPG